MKTLKQFIIVFLMLGMCIAANAQNFSYGVQGSVNFTDLTLKSASGKDQLTGANTGFGFGALLGYRFNDHISLDMEAMYVQKGGTQMANGANPNIDISMSVLEIPVLLKAAFGNSFRPYVKAGPALGFILNSEAQAELGGVVQGQALNTYKADLGDVLKNVDFSVVLGAGISFAWGHSQVFIEGRYNLGMVDLYKGGQITWQSGEEAFVVKGNEATELYNKGFQIIVGISFPSR